MNKVTKIIIGIVIAFLVIGAGIFGVRKLIQKTGGGNTDKVFVESVKSLSGGGVGLQTRYMGIVESQETKGVNKDSEQKIAEMKVKEGDIVSEGDILFTYDTEQMDLTLQQKKLELQNIINTITTTNAQINDLTTQRNQATSDDERLNYTNQINSLKVSLKECEYNKSVKELEIQRQEASIEAAYVVAPMDGIIKEINDNATGSSDSSDSDGAFITIMAVGDYRIKGTVTELNIYSLYSGMPVIVRSRVDESIMWEGSIDTIDMEPQKNDEMEYNFSNQQGSTKYSFYVSLTAYDNLMLGQHVYIEEDNGQTAEKSGLWIPAYYVMVEEEGNFVWVENAEGRIEKRAIEIGEYDNALYAYEILGGITEEDYIAYPTELVSEGAKATRNIDEATINGSNGSDSEGEDYMPEGGDYMPEDGDYMPEDDMDGAYDDEYVPDEDIDDLPDDFGIDDAVDGE